MFFLNKSLNFEKKNCTNHVIDPIHIYVNILTRIRLVSRSWRP